MNIDIKDISNNLTVINKDTTVYEKGAKIIPITIDDIKYDSKFEKAVKIIALVTEMNDIEYNIYRRIISWLIAKDNMMIDSSVIIIDTDELRNLANCLNKSVTHIYRNIASLVAKGILNYYKDDKGIPVNTKYIINPKYDVSKYFNKDIANIIMIQL